MAEKLFQIDSNNDNNEKPFSINSPLKDFLEYLETAYLVHGRIDGTLSDTSLRKPIDWSELARNRFVTSIAEIVTNEGSKNLIYYIY